MNDRFWTKVDCQGPVPEYAPHLGPCWLWTAAKWEKGYGQFGVAGRMRRAHRVSFEMFFGPIPEGLEIDHLCRVPSCVNPSHLEAVTRQENQLRGFGASGMNARKTHCVRGHPFSEENVYVSTRGDRICRACDRERYYRKRSA